MTRKTRLYLATALSTLTTTTAFADVTALQIWDDWQALLARTGAEVRFEQSISDGILTINDLTFTAKDSGNDGITRVKLGSLVFQEQDDGSVMILLPTDAPIVVDTGNEQITLNQSHKDLSLVVSGSPMDLTYRYTVAEVSLRLVEMMVIGEPVDGLSAVISLNAISGTTQSRDAGLREMVQDVTIGAASYSIDFNPDDEDKSLASQGTLTDVQSSFDLAIPENLKTGTMQEVMEAGLRALGHFGYSDLTASLMLNDAGDVANATLSSQQVAVNTKFGKGQDDKLAITQDISFGPLKVLSDTDIGHNDKYLQFDLAIAQIGAGYTVVFPDVYRDGSFEDLSLPEALDAGLSINLGFGYNGINGAFSHDAGDKSSDGSLTSATAGFNLSLDRDVLLYTADTGTTEMRATTPELPIGPVEFTVSEVSSHWVIPLKVSGDPAPFSIREVTSNLSISDNLWAKFDADGLLPRGPLSYVWDVSGTGNWLIDPFDERFQDEDLGETKGELHSLSLNELKLSGAGIDLTGAGAFTFNNDDLETFDGIPAPIGALDLKLVGLNKLLDALIELGFVADDEAMGARMGLGLFTIKGDGEDTLISHIETNDDGHVLANGKRLK
ncbi:hypothetical protein [Profundibacter sp.]